MVTVQDGGQVLFRFLVPCAAGCESLGAPVRPGCRILHFAAHPDWNIARLAASGQPICLAKKIFYQGVYEVALYLYTNGSLLLQRYPGHDSLRQAFDDIPAYIKAYAGDIA
jgi:hypothetical protein